MAAVDSPAAPQSISVAEAAELYGRADVRFVDVNEDYRWRRAHVRGAVHVNPDFERGDLPAADDALLVFYCSDPSCDASPTAARRALEMGLSRVAVMPEGITGWIAAAQPVESE